jgi:3',5'-cyclic AMP phosphodiesterase CpdA
MAEAGSSCVFRLAHISDLHIGPLPPVATRDLLGKRLFGYLSWRLRRYRVHRREVLAALRRDLRAIAPDHIAITGDLVNIALPAEFDQAATWLRALGPPERISVIPGNHDAYVRIECARSLARWADYMASDPGSVAGLDGGCGFPWLRLRGPLALIGLSSAVATPPGFATGRLGRPQLEALDRLLAMLARQGRCRVVLLHHPPLAVAGGRRRRLIDAAAFRRIVGRHGAELILHGHEHVPIKGEIQGPKGPIPVVGVPSASSLDPRPARRARYQIYEIERTAGGWSLGSQIRVHDQMAGNFGPLPTEAAQPCSRSA